MAESGPSMAQIWPTPAETGYTSSNPGRHVLNSGQARPTPPKFGRRRTKYGPILWPTAFEFGPSVYSCQVRSRSPPGQTWPKEATAGRARGKLVYSTPTFPQTWPGLVDTTELEGNPGRNLPKLGELWSTSTKIRRVRANLGPSRVDIPSSSLNPSQAWPSFRPSMETVGGTPTPNVGPSVGGTCWLYVGPLHHFREVTSGHPFRTSFFVARWCAATPCLLLEPTELRRTTQR